MQLGNGGEERAMGRNGERNDGFKSLFRRITGAEHRYLRMGLYGAAGSGKTRTAIEVAIGICKDLADGKPIAFIDTEGGAVDWVTAIVEAQGLELWGEKTRDFGLLLRLLDAAEHEAGCIIIDSVSHFWDRIQDEFLEANPSRRGYISVADWKPIKKQFSRLTERVLGIQTNIIVCGRQSGVYEERTNDRGKSEVVRVGDKMKAEGEFEYEPSLMVKMELIHASSSKKWKGTINRATVLKDRSDSIQGAVFDFPTYASFKPFIEKLAPNGRHVAMDESEATGQLFGAADPEEARIRLRKKDLADILGSAFDLAGIGGNTGDAKKRKAELLQEAFGTPSGKEAWGILTFDQLEYGVSLIKFRLGQGPNPNDMTDDLPDMTVGGSEGLQ
jgi:hypothetical protein